VRLRGLVYRAYHPRWAFSPTSGEGAARYGGRFNPVGMDALYTSLRLESAWLEAQQGFPFKAQPMTLCAYAVDCDPVADLTDAATVAALAIAASDLACPWEDLADRGRTLPSWEIALRLKASGYAGIVVPSFAPGATAADRNAVFWHWADTPPHQVRVIDDQGCLPKDESSRH
jgi:RES domain-containing protein